ncbi:PAS domain S-box protein [Crocinitomix algicola]|uniref:PAS domain S-box protein n=1 Tax=Crocinitomix algicola TaxID=1740263 RepID=UPI000871CC2A|nr:PAS domain S-box protein [Crocinitomix algicola]
MPQNYFLCKKWSRIICALIFACFHTYYGAAQQEFDRIDSLIMELSLLDQNKEKASVLFELSEAYEDTDCEFAKKYARLSLNLSHRIDDPFGEIAAANKLGELFMYCDMNIIGAIEKFNRAIRVANKIGAIEYEPVILSNIAYANYLNENYTASIEYFEDVISLTSDYDSLGNYSYVTGFIGRIYIEMGDTLRGMSYYNQLYSSMDNDALKNISFPNHFFISDYFLIKGAYDEAERVVRRAIHNIETLKKYRWTAFGYYLLGKIHYYKGDLLSAIAYGRQSLDIAESKKYYRERILNYFLLADAFRANTNYLKSLDYLNKGYALTDSLGKIEKKSLEFVYRQEVDEVLAQKEADNTMNRLLAKELETENDQLIIRFAAIGLVITFIFVFILYRRLRKTKKLYGRLEKQKEELQKLSIVAANIEQMVMIVGKDDRIKWVNRAFEKKFGYLKLEVINKTPFEVLKGEKTDTQTIKDIENQIFEKKVAFETKLYQYAKNKQAFLTHIHITPILDENNFIERYIIIAHDITEEQKIAENIKELSLVASNTTNSIVILDQEQKVSWVNNSFTELTGLTTENVRGRHAMELYNAPFLNLQEKIELQDKYSDLESFTVQVESVNRLTDQKAVLSMNVTPVFDDNGSFYKYISVATDISDLKRLEEQYESLVEGSADMISELSLDGYFTFVNDVVAHTLGYEKDELIGMYFVELVAPDHKRRVEKFYAYQVRTNKSTSHLEFEVVKKNGEKIWVGQRAKLIVNHKEQATGLSIVTREITEQKNAENALKKTYDNANLLSEIGMQITSTLSIEDIIHQLYENINKIMDASVFGIAIPNEDYSSLNFLQIIEKGEPLKDLKFDLKDDSKLSVICYKKSKEIYISNFEVEIGEYVEGEVDTNAVAGGDTVSVIYLPLIIQNRTIGVLTVQSFNENAYDKFQKSLVKSLATFVAIALENATLYETMEEKISERTQEVRIQKEELEINYSNTRLLSEIGQFISSTLNLNEIFEELYEKVGQLMRVDLFGIRIYDQKVQKIHAHLTAEKGNRLAPKFIDLTNENDYNVWCVNNRKEIFINDNEVEYKNYVKEFIPLHGVKMSSLLYYPMIVEQKLIGVLTIQSYQKNAYQDYHLDILKTLASYIGTVIDNAALYDTLERKVEERTLALKEKNEDITASINYAQRLQRGILPSRHFMEQLLPDSFVFFRPKDIVSGDFYWIDRTQNKIFFAVVDCTGHGVPGAMMSIIGRNLLDQALNEKGLTLPAHILNFLQVALSTAFGQNEDQQTELYDGMDLGLVSIDLKTNMLDFAGANSSLYLIQDDELIVLKGDKTSISAEYKIENSYTHTEIEIKSGDMLYLSSDGFPDQFGGSRYKKFTYNRMYSLFKEIHNLPIDDQYDEVKNSFTEWKSDHAQIDDICVMGVRIP